MKKINIPLLHCTLMQQGEPASLNKSSIGAYRVLHPSATMAVALMATTCAGLYSNAVRAQDSATAVSASASGGTSHGHHAQSATSTTPARTVPQAEATPVATAPTAAAPAQGAGTTVASPKSKMEEIYVRAQRRLLREKDSPSAATVLGEDHIRQAGITGSIVSILRDAPSVNVYSQGIGNNEPVMSIRGARGSEVASTLDGVPMQDLLNGGSGGYLNSIIGGRFNLDQISGVTIMPGVAYPASTTFGTIGGTIDYHSLRPAQKRQIDIFGSLGSYGTYNEGFQFDSGKLNGWMGEGINAPRLMIKYSNMQTRGYIDHTPARYNNMEFAFDKPYDDGMSLFQLTALYNTGSGKFVAEPLPIAYLNEYGKYANYDPSQAFSSENNDYFTLILKNDKYINDYITAGVTGFYEFSDSTMESYANPAAFAPNGGSGAYDPPGTSIFAQNPAGFGEQGLYGYGNLFYDPQVYTYDGASRFPAGSAACPSSVANMWSAAGQASPCGYNAQLSYTRTDTYGIRPRLTITPPTVWGIQQTIKVGALIAKETGNSSPTYAWGTSNIPRTSSNLISGYDGGPQRVMYQGYFQDKIDLFKNTLHITPGFVVEGTQSSLTGSKIYGGTVPAGLASSAYCQQYGCGTGAYSAHKWDREWLPFINVTYDLDKVLPAAKGLSLYGSWGNSALYAPTSDFSPKVMGSVPNASIVHMAEGGIKYNRSNLTVSIDYFYQKIDRDFGMFNYQSGPDAGMSIYTNAGQRAMKGEEMSVVYQVTPQIQLFGNFSHLSDHYKATALESISVQEDQFGIATNGSPVTGVPQWLSTIGIDYNKRSMFRHGDDFNVRFQGQYTGHQYTSYDLTGSENVGPIPGIGSYGSYAYYNATAGSTTYDPHGGIAPYMIFSLDLNYEMPLKNAGPLKSLNFDVNVYNLFNTFYWQYKYRQISPSSCGNFTSGPFAGQAVSNYGCSKQFSDGLPGQPASVTFSVRARFG